ncbi:MAG: membrane glycosyltransferase [Alphaproteobacteria bacterium]|jgi:membrane glycosyltransferase
MTNGPTMPTALPPEAPLAMPRQPLNTGRQPTRHNPPLSRRIVTTASRLMIFTATGTLTAYGTIEMYAVTSAGGVTPLQWLFLTAFSLTFAWIGFSACQAIVGFIRLIRQDLFHRRRTTTRHMPMRTAVLLPIYNEDPVQIAAGVRAMAEGLAKTSPDDFAFFLLSDTTDPEAWVGEQAVFAALIDNPPSGCPVFYRHRHDNTERKAGNIADWVARWGASYSAMILLDADSLIAPATMVEMRDRLAADPGLGLIQTLPGIVAGQSLFARLQQFANRCYGPIFGNGLAAWHGTDGNYWGHNAIIRTAAFAACCRLPHLAGAPPFGGHILSHDFIEAALLRRAGWGVRFDTDLKYSFEEAPPSLVDVMIRDRRWCQGNLQHSRVLTAAGMPTASRLHMLSGILGYLSAPLWMLLVVIGLALAVQVAVSGPDYFPGPALFPIWPVFESARAVQLFVLSMGVLLIPKFLGWLSATVNLRRCRAFGGPVLLTLGVMAEIILSALYAPVLMLVQSHIVWQVLRGGDSGWQPQRRGDGGMSFGAAFGMHFRHAVIGLSTALGTWAIDSGLFLWTLPLTSALILSPVSSWLSGSNRAGRALRRLGIFHTPEERGHDTSGILTRRQAYMPWAGDMQLRQSSLAALANDPALNAWHCRQMSGRIDGHRAQHVFNPSLFVARAKAEREPDPALLSDWLTPEEKRAFLHDVDLVEGLLTAEPQLLQA